MKRVIKFRGRRLGKWYYGDLEYSRHNERTVIHTYKDDGSYGEQYRVERDTIGQFTGLRDKNGKEIYEGDIIVHASGSSIRYIVEWHNTELVGKQIGSSSYAGISYWIDVTEVIGNIYDNPELLKGDEQ